MRGSVGSHDGARAAGDYTRRVAALRRLHAKTARQAQRGNQAPLSTARPIPACSGFGAGAVLPLAGAEDELDGCPLVHVALP